VGRSKSHNGSLRKASHIIGTLDFNLEFIKEFNIEAAAGVIFYDLPGNEKEKTPPAKRQKD